MKRILASLLSIVVVFVVAAGGVLAAGQGESEEPEVFNFGFLSSLSGTFAGVAETQRKSFVLAIEEVNARGGLDMPWGKVPIEYMVKDDEAKLDVGVRRFREMVDADLHALTGGIWNPMSAALNEDMKINPVIYVPGYVPAMDMFMEGNPAVCSFTPTFTPWSIGYIAGKAIVQTLDQRTVFILARADSWGTTIQAGLEAALDEYGGELVGVAETPAGTVDYSAILNNVRAADPDVFFTTMFGGDAIANLKQAYDMGLYDEMVIFNAWTANIVAKGIPAEALEDLYALAWFYWDIEGIEDQALVERTADYSDAYMERWDEPPDNMGTAAYVAAELIIQAVEEAGTFDPAAVAEALMSNDFDTVKGTISFREDHQPVSPHASILLRGKAPDEREGDWDFFHAIDSHGGDEALPPLSAMGY